MADTTQQKRESYEEITDDYRGIRDNKLLVRWCKHQSHSTIHGNINQYNSIQYSAVQFNIVANRCVFESYKYLNSISVTKYVTEEL